MIFSNLFDTKTVR